MASFAPTERVRLVAQVKRSRQELTPSKLVLVTFPFTFSSVCESILSAHFDAVADKCKGVRDYMKQYQLLSKSGEKIDPEFIHLLETDQEVILVERQAQFPEKSVNKRSRSVSGQLFTVRKLYNDVSCRNNLNIFILSFN